MSFLGLLRREPRTIAFGLLYTAAATAGQTLLISLFLPGIKASFGLDDAQIAFVFTATTLASAAALWRLGAWMDRTDLLRYAVACGVLLALSCALMAASPVLAGLVAGMFCLRLAGNGLLNHVAVTATARYFSAERGRALALVLLGASLGEGLLPAVLVPLIVAVGWRYALLALGCFGLVLALAGARAVSGHAAFRAPAPQAAGMPEAGRPALRPARGNTRFFALTAPLFAAMWAFITAAVFHQALIAESLGVSLHWFAVSFAAFVAVRVPVTVFTGKLIDRTGSAWLFAGHLLPLAAGTIALAAIGTPWTVPLYWLGAGVTSGVGTVVQATVLAERVPPERLGGARSLLGAAGIVASATGPSLYGAALAAGASVTAILWGTVAFFAAATVLGVLATAADPGRPRLS